MTFTGWTYENMLSVPSPVQARLFPQYLGPRNDFDIIVVGSGMGGGVLADDLANRLGSQKRILVLEAGSYLFPTHVFNLCRFPNDAVARGFACKTFGQSGGDNDQNYIHERPQLNFGGRSIFWSGLIPTIQPWELEFFPPRVQQDLTNGLLGDAGKRMNASITLGETARRVVEKLRQSSLAHDFEIEETPRALHQPYLRADGSPTASYFVEPTGVFNTAELLLNQAGLVPGVSHGDFNGLQLLLNHYVEDIKPSGGNGFELITRNVLDGTARAFYGGTVVLAGGSIESPKLLRRSSLFGSLPGAVQSLVGRGLTDHPTTSWIETFATNLDDVPLPKDQHAKIVFYSKGHRDHLGEIRFPFNVEMNINHEYWHLRENDPNADHGPDTAASRVEIKFSFGNFLDGGNEIKAAAPFGYVPDIEFKNLKWLDHLAGSRFPALAGWHKSYPEIWAVLNDITYRIFSQFRHYGSEARPAGEVWFGQGGKGFGSGTVHHAVGTLRMPHRSWYRGGTEFESVVDEDLRVVGTQNLYACDMSVLPFSSAANPVRTLVALALRLSRHFG